MILPMFPNRILVCCCYFCIFCSSYRSYCVHWRWEIQLHSSNEMWKSEHWYVMFWILDISLQISIQIYPTNWKMKFDSNRSNVVCLSAVNQSKNALLLFYESICANAFLAFDLTDGNNTITPKQCGKFYWKISKLLLFSFQWHGYQCTPFCTRFCVQLREYKA